jgi:hypothetical protein
MPPTKCVGFLGGQLARILEIDPDPLVEESVEARRSRGDDDSPMSREPVKSLPMQPKRIGVIARWFRQQDPRARHPTCCFADFAGARLRINAPELDPKLLEAPPTPTRAKLKTLLIDEKWQ